MVRSPSVKQARFQNRAFGGQLIFIITNFGKHSRENIIEALCDLDHPTTGNGLQVGRSQFENRVRCAGSCPYLRMLQ